VQGRVGDRIQVKAGLGGATLEGIVRGPGMVELEAGKGRQ
jgi:flagella basal body P-ring formation protein FlgA